MKYKIATFTILLFLTRNSVCQVADTLFLDDQFQEVNKEIATYFRLIETHSDGTSNLFVQTFYASGQIKSRATCVDKSCTSKDGDYVSYFENGNKQEEGQWFKERQVGKWNEWFENGQLKYSGTYVEGSKKGVWQAWYVNGQLREVGEHIGDWDTEPQLSFKLLSYWSVTGNKTVEHGDGNVTYYHDDTLVVSSYGQYKNGFKIGLWKGFSNKNRPEYEETYENDNVNGISWDENGSKFTYDRLEDLPVQDGGMITFYQHVHKTMKYPSNCRRAGIQGKVFVQFEVDEDGQIVNVKTIKGIGRSCDMEAERVVNSAPKWNPGKQRGQPVKVKMVIPLTFKLG